MGTFSNVVRVKNVEECGKGRKGTFSGEGARGCQVYKEGEYSDVVGSERCGLCAEGTFNDVLGAVGVEMCRKCGRGKLSERGARHCLKCEAGHYQDREGATSCIECPAGTFGNVPGLESAEGCIKCGLGTTSGEGSGGCVACGMRYYADVEAMERCKECPAGMFGNGFGLKNVGECRKCPKGMFSDEGGTTSCTRCGLGTY